MPWRTGGYPYDETSKYLQIISKKQTLPACKMISWTPPNGKQQTFRGCLS